MAANGYGSRRSSGSLRSSHGREWLWVSSKFGVATLQSWPRMVMGLATDMSHKGLAGVH
jgi:hypothetical protein